MRAHVFACITVKPDLYFVVRRVARQRIEYGVWINHSVRSSQLVRLSVEGRLHVDAAVRLIVSHPANRSAVEGRPTANFALVHHWWLRLYFGCLWKLEFQELVGFLKASKWQCSPKRVMAMINTFNLLFLFWARHFRQIYCAKHVKGLKNNFDSIMYSR